MRDHDEKLSKQEADARIASLLEQVGLNRDVADRYPHELSGGMKQRVCIAIAICLRPKVIIADEPTSALDVVVQRQVMETLRRVQEQLGASVILVGHDMGLMAQFVDRLGVMYAGRLAEVSPVNEIFAEPLHPYTQLLIASLPSLEEKGKFQGIPACRRRCSTARRAARSTRAVRTRCRAARSTTRSCRRSGPTAGSPATCTTQTSWPQPMGQ